MANYGVKGSSLQYTMAGSTSAFTVIGQIQTINAPGMKVGIRDVTHLLSAVKECEATIGDPQEFTGTLIYDANDDSIKTLAARATTPSTVLGGDTWKLVLPTTTKVFQFQGVLTDFTPTGGDVEGTWLANFAIKPTRAITYPTTT